MDSDNEQKLRDDEWQNESQDTGGLFNPERDEEVLPQDGSRPAAPAEYTEDIQMPVDHPQTDTDIDPGGAYYGGIADEVGYKPGPEQDDDDAVGPLEIDYER